MYIASVANYVKYTYKYFYLVVLFICLLVDERLISISLRRAYVTLLHHPLLKHHREGSCLQAILFQIYYEYNVCRLNNILSIGHLRDTDIRQCIYNHTHLIYCVSFDSALFCF